MSLICISQKFSFLLLSKSKSDMADTNDHKSIFREWLEKLQQESWQLELLISGFSIFGIYQARTLIADLDFARNGYFDDGSAWLGLVVFIFKKGWLIFFLNLLIHVIMRGLWIGAIGLRYVSEEIEYDKFQYSDIFTRFLKKSVGSYDDFIERLEKACSVIFAYTFLLFLLFMSFMFFFMQIIFVVQMIQKINPTSTSLVATSGLFAVFYFLLGSLVFFDLITLGGFKKVKNTFFSKAYFYLYRFFGFVTLSFLYRPLLYNFIDHNYTKKLFYLSIPYIGLIAFSDAMVTKISNPYRPERDYLLSKGQLLDENLYDDLRILRLNEFPNEERKMNKKFLSWVSMEQYEINKSLSSFFIRMDRNLMKYMQKDSSLTPYFKSGYVFRWFNSHVLKDPQINTLSEAKADSIKSLYTQRRRLNKELKSQDNPVIQKQLDSIKNVIELMEDNYNVRITKLKDQKAEKIKAKYLEGYRFFVDTTQIKIETSFYFNHPHYGEEGLKCYFNTDSLSKGLHNFKVVRTFISQSDSPSRDSIIIPIIKL